MSPGLTACKYSDWQLFIWAGQNHLVRLVKLIWTSNIGNLEMLSQCGWATACNVLRRSDLTSQDQNIVLLENAGRHSLCLVMPVEALRGLEPMSLFSFRAVFQTHFAGNVLSDVYSFLCNT